MCTVFVMSNKPKSRSADLTGVGPSLRYLRKAAGLTLVQAADAAGASFAYLSRVETGDATPTPGWVADMTATLGRILAEQEDAA